MAEEVIARLARLARRLDRTAVAERIIEEMANRQGHRFGPYFEWSLASETFLQRFNAVWARRSQALTFESLEEFAIAFVDEWPQGAVALRVVPDNRDSIANPPFSTDGMWPAFLGARDRK
jgi:hypothetical protein